MNPHELTGRARTHIKAMPESGAHLHEHAIAPFRALCAAAAREGLDLHAQSSFRDFERQLQIWNGKFAGERPVLDIEGKPIEVLSLAESARIDAILLWSALPGASRHHWGTDLDIIDRAALQPGYQARLVPEEYAADGVFGAAAVWLERHAPRFGFFRPFRGRRSGVQPEPWHYSFAPVAEDARRALSVEVLEEALEAAPLLGKASVLERIGALHEKYVSRIDPL